MDDARGRRDRDVQLRVEAALLLHCECRRDARRHRGCPWQVVQWQMAPAGTVPGPSATGLPRICGQAIRQRLSTMSFTAAARREASDNDRWRTLVFVASDNLVSDDRCPGQTP